MLCILYKNVCTYYTRMYGEASGIDNSKILIMKYDDSSARVYRLEDRSFNHGSTRRTVSEQLCW